MPLELRRASIPDLSFPAVSPSADRDELLNVYLREFGRTVRTLKRSVTVPLIGTDRGVDPALSLRVGVRAASIFLRDHSLHIVIAVPEDADISPGAEGYGGLASYIAARYTGSMAGGIFGRPFERSAPPVFPTSPFGPGVSPAERDVTYCASMPPNVAVPGHWQEAEAAPSKKPKAKSGIRKASAPAAAMSELSLDEMLRRTDAGFSQRLMELIDLSGRKDSDVYKRANIDRKLFSKIRSNPAYRPSKNTALALAVALELDLEGVRDLIGRAGYSLTHSSQGDIIVEYFVLHKNYDIFEINEKLFAFDQPILGGA